MAFALVALVLYQGVPSQSNTPAALVSLRLSLLVGSSLSLLQRLLRERAIIDILLGDLSQLPAPPKCFNWITNCRFYRSHINTVIC